MIGSKSLSLKWQTQAEYVRFVLCLIALTEFISLKRGGKDMIARLDRVHPKTEKRRNMIAKHYSF